MSHLELAREFISQARFDLAQRELQQGLKLNPADPELRTQYGLLLCWLQQEAEAVKYLNGSSELAQLLVNYSACRQQLAAKVGFDDKEGRKLASEIAALTDLQPDPSIGIKLTACLIVKNEEQTLPRCLSSLTAVCDEIIVVDTGSSDKTVEIAESYGATIGHFDWINDFSAARNHALSLATGNWILWIDADEELDPGGITMLREGLMRPHFGGYFIKIINFMTEGSRTDQYVHTPVRLFQRLPEIFFTGAIHEQILPQILSAGLLTATIQGAEIWHYGYTAEMMEERGKEARTISLLESELAKQPDDSFQWFNLANVYAVANNPAESERAAREAIRCMAPESTVGSLTWYLLAYAQMEQGRASDALETCKQAAEAGYHDILIQFQKTHALSVLGRFDEALVEVEKCLKMEWPAGLNGDYGIFTHKRLSLKGQILAQLGRYDEAIQWLDASLAVDPGYKYAKFLKGSILAQTGHGHAALEYLEPCLGTVGIGIRAHRYAGQAYWDEGNWAKAHEHWGKAIECGDTEGDLGKQWISAAEKLNDPAQLSLTYIHASEFVEFEPEHWINWGRTLRILKQHADALGKFQKAVELAPRNANASFNLADEYYTLGSFTQAIETYQSALALAPGYADGWFCFGNALAQIGANEASAVAYRQALTIDPNHERAKHNLEVVTSVAA